MPKREPQGTAETTGSKESLEERIGAAIVEVVGSIGFTETTEERIIERAGVRREEFHSLYADKADCFIKTYTAIESEFMVRIAHAFAEGKSWREGLRGAAYFSFDYFREDPARARFTTIVPLEAGEKAAALLDQSLEMLAELIDAGRYETEDP